MPFEFERDDNGKRLTVTTSGVLTVAEMLSVAERQAAEGMWTYSMLSIARDVCNYPSPSEIRSLVAGVKKLVSIFGTRGPVALVDARPALFGMWRVYGTLAEAIPLNLNVFRNRESAEARLAKQPTPHRREEPAQAGVPSDRDAAQSRDERRPLVLLVANDA